jgi:hypothetical protein
MNAMRIRCVALAALAVALPLGCASQPPAYQTAEPLRLQGVPYAQVFDAAEETLDRMRFAIEKCDAEQGLIRTEPLRGAQFFEFWRNDNAGWSNVAEANLHTVRRSVELRVTQQAGLVCVACDVSIQRLSLPENEVASISQAYRMHSRSSTVMQRLQLSPQQRRGVAWIDLGQDSRLAARILDALAHNLRQSEDDART